MHRNLLLWYIHAFKLQPFSILENNYTTSCLDSAFRSQLSIFIFFFNSFWRSADGLLCKSKHACIFHTMKMFQKHLFGPICNTRIKAWLRSVDKQAVWPKNCTWPIRIVFCGIVLHTRQRIIAPFPFFYFSTFHRAEWIPPLHTDEAAEDIKSYMLRGNMSPLFSSAT